MPFELPVDRVAVMGVLNVTPDSFSDGGLYLAPKGAIDHAERMVSEGADVIDVGGESTRPGAEPVDAAEELQRVLPVVSALAALGIAVSIDTSKPEVAHACLKSGAVIVNDVTALRSDEMKRVCAEAGCTVCLMHMQGDPRTMQASPAYGDVVTEVTNSLVESAICAERAGVHRSRIWLDPGIGFGKTAEHNLKLLNHLDRIVETGYPVLVGVSRKSFIGRLLSRDGSLPVGERLVGSLAAQVIAQERGARIVRTHDVLETCRAMTIAHEIISQG